MKKHILFINGHLNTGGVEKSDSIKKDSKKVGWEAYF